MTRQLGTQLWILCLLLVGLGTARPAVFYVSSDATGNHTGDCWADAFTSIQAGIDAAHTAGGGEVWAKSGVYSGFPSPPATDSFEALDPNAVDIIGEERNLSYTSSGAQHGCHLTVLYLDGEVSGIIPPAPFGGTSNQDSFASRLSALMRGKDDVLVFANHPSFRLVTEDLRISAQDLSEAANARAFDAVELKNAEDVAKWDYALANLDDQAGDCSKMPWGIRADDEHTISNVGYQIYGAVMGCIPTPDQDPVYADRRLALRDMIRRGSFVSLPANSKCGMPSYVMESSGGAADSMQVRIYVHNIGGATSAGIRFFGCDYASGGTPGTLLCSAPLTLDADNTVSYYLTTTGTATGLPLTARQKANIKYIRPVITWQGTSSREAHLQPVRIRSNGDWWGGPAYTLAGAHAAVGPSPYPVGGTDTGETVYFNTHCHTTSSDGDASPAAMRARYWDNYGGLDPAKPRFTIVTDHDRRTPFNIPVSSVVEMRQGVQLYGGFAGWETSRDQRNWTANPTIIDGQGHGRCVLMDGTHWSDGASALVDGVVLRSGEAANAYGGGMLIDGCSPTIRNCAITGNMAAYGGGLCASSGSCPTVIDCSFTGNRANGLYDGGGGIYLLDSILTITGCTLDGNTATFGGAISSLSSQMAMGGCTLTGNTAGSGGGLHLSTTYVDVARCTFRGNSCSGDGGAILSAGASGTIEGCEFTLNSAGQISGHGGGVCHRGHNIGLVSCRFTGNTAHDGGGVFYESTDSTIGNCVFSGNRAIGDGGRGGAIFTRDRLGSSVVHNTIVGNSATLGGAVFSLDSPSALVNNIMAFNSGGIGAAGAIPILLHNDVYSNTIDYSGINPGATDISADPAFVDRSAGDYHLTAGSPCVDAGTRSVPGLPSRDMDGRYRPSGRAVDIGAYELQLLNVHPKSLADGDPVALDAAVVTAVFPGFFYIEADSREYGIRVCKADHGLAEGMRASVAGIMRTNADGERYIEADSAAENGAGSVAPVGMMARAIGGSAWLSIGTAIAGQTGVAGGAGLSNIGLLIRTWGRVTAIGSGYLYVDDGSGSKDGTYTGSEENTGVRVICDPAGLEVGDRVQATGMSSCFAPAPGTVARRVLSRRSDDLRRVEQ